MELVGSAAEPLVLHPTTVVISQLPEIEKEHVIHIDYGQVAMGSRPILGIIVTNGHQPPGDVCRRAKWWGLEPIVFHATWTKAFLKLGRAPVAKGENVTDWKGERARARLIEVS